MHLQIDKLAQQRDRKLFHRHTLPKHRKSCPEYISTSSSVSSHSLSLGHSHTRHVRDMDIQGENAHPRTKRALHYFHHVSPPPKSMCHASTKLERNCRPSFVRLCGPAPNLHFPAYLPNHPGPCLEGYCIRSTCECANALAATMLYMATQRPGASSWSEQVARSR